MEVGIIIVLATLSLINVAAAERVHLHCVPKTTAITLPRSSKARSASKPMTSPTTASRRHGLADREQRARIIGEWLQTEARFLAS